jgi:hypothetical protein
MRGVAQERDPPEAPAIERIAIDHRVFEDAFGHPKEGRKIDETELPIGKSRQEILDPALTRPVRATRLLAADPEQRDPVGQRPPRRAASFETGWTTAS